MSLKFVVFLVGYQFFFFGTIVGMLYLERRRRKTRRPFGDDIRLLRGAGETQLKWVHEFEENLFLWMAAVALLPLLLTYGFLLIAKAMPVESHSYALIVAGLLFAGAFFTTARWASHRIKEYTNRSLGYFGERMVAEHLEALKTSGWRMVHDFPGKNNGSSFNIDHVAVGPQGVFAIETKTRRKGNARPGKQDHRVVFNGRSMEWPWGSDDHGLEQAERNALWLAKLINEETGVRVHVSPVLTLPGWFVETKPGRESRLAKVTNPKNLPALLASGPAILDQPRINTIAAKLEAHCRDVEY